MIKFIKINRIIFLFLTFFIPIFLFYWDKRLLYFLLIFSLPTSLFLTLKYKEYNKINQFKIMYNALLFSFFIGGISFFHIYEIADGKRHFSYNLYLACSSSSAIIFISSIFFGAYISLKKHTKEIIQLNTKEKYKLLVILYFILFILNFAILEIFN